VDVSPQTHTWRVFVRNDGWNVRVVSSGDPAPAASAVNALRGIGHAATSLLSSPRAISSAIAVIASAVLAVTAFAARTSTEPSAFSRPAVASDRLPPSAVAYLQPHDSRRVATYSRSGREWRVYIFKSRLHAEGSICVFTYEIGRGGGVGCFATARFFGPGREVNADEGHVLSGVTSDRVARLVVVGSLGVVHEVPLTRDHGFIYNCRAYDGCSCVVVRLKAFDGHGRLITNQDWRGSKACRRR
jgi:hypothetical protein